MFGSLLEKISTREFYERCLGFILGSADKDGNVKVKCPFHNDDTASLSINLKPEKGAPYRCHGCGAQGTLIAFYQRYYELRNGRDIDVRDAVRGIAKLMDLEVSTFDRTIIDSHAIEKFQQNLTETPEGRTVKKHLIENRCLSPFIIESFKLGYDPESKRVIIPIFDAEGNIVNLRKWLPEYFRITKFDHDTKLISEAGYGTARLFPYVALQEEEVILVEGEMDALALISAGFNAVTGTGGANTFSETWCRYFAGKDIVLIYDNDKRGQEAADSVSCKLEKYNKSLKIVYLAEATVAMDPTEFMFKYKADASELLRVKIANTPVFLRGEQRGDKIYAECNLFNAANSSLINKYIKFSALVIGGDETPFGVPKVVRCRCDKTVNPCLNCPAQLSKGVADIIMEPDDKHLMDYARTKTRLWDFVHKDLFNVGKVRGCGAGFEVQDYYNLEDVSLIPDVEFSFDDYQWAIRSAYINMHGIQVNNVYNFEGITTIDPITTKVTHLLSKAELSNQITSSADPHMEVELDGVIKPLHEHLKIFECEPNQSAHEKMMEIYYDLETHVTRIVRRRDVLQALDLVYHSPIHFDFESNDRVMKGWLDALIIGDTHCGKSVTAYKLREHYRLGVILDGKITSRVGLTGGYVDVGGGRKKHVLGVLPLNDRKYVLIDEGLTQEILQELRMARSSGQIVSAKLAQYNSAKARVRLVMMSNPKNGRALASHTYGVLAIKDLIGDDADISRFDIVVSVGSLEVSIDDINTGVRTYTKGKYTSDLCHANLQWAWARQTTDWKVLDETRRLILERSNSISKIFDSSIPIIAGASVRYKIARGACAVAARLHSTDESGTRVIVKPDHVDAFLTFLQNALTKPSLNYHLYSSQRRKLQSLPRKQETEKYLMSHPFTVVDFLQNQRQFSKRDFIDGCGLAENLAKEVFLTLLQLKVIEQRGAHCYPTPGFLDLMATFVHPDPDGELGNII